MGEQWRSDEVLAWTEREGPGRGPAGPSRKVWFLLAGAMSVVFLGMMSSDTLCPEHRVWVLVIGGAALIAAGTAIVGLIDGWAGAPLLALVSAVGGVAVGLIDAIHAPTRGRLIAVAFALVFVVACWLVWRQERLRRWDRQVARSLRPDDAGLLASAHPHQAVDARAARALTGPSPAAFSSPDPCRATPPSAGTSSYAWPSVCRWLPSPPSR